jgi:YD repeat-containing protein
VPSAHRPIGGSVALYEFANALARRTHAVTVVHIDFVGDHRDPVVVLDDAVTSVDDLAWFGFEPGVEHQFMRRFVADDFPPADVISFPPLGAPLPPHAGQPFLFVQGHQVFTPEFEIAAYRTPAPKVCVARWLADVVRSFGCPPHQVEHVAYGLRHDKYRVRTAVEDRPPRVSMLYNAAPTKSANYGLDALALVKERVPAADVVVFGGSAPVHPIPEGVAYLVAPPQHVIVDDIYNRSRVFINSSTVEGFGLACVEAMACGVALVTTSNGGSDDYAVAGETALVSEPADVATMAEHIERLLADDDARVRMARNGRAFVRRFDWDASGRRLEEFLLRYLADPVAYQQSPPA